MPRQERYDFELYDNGEVWEIDCLKAFGPPFGPGSKEAREDLERFRTAIRLRAHRNNKTAHTRLVKDAPMRLLLQITRKGEKPAPVFKHVDKDSDLIKLNSFQACPMCGKSGRIEAASAPAGTTSRPAGPDEVATTVKQSGGSVSELDYFNKQRTGGVS